MGMEVISVRKEGDSPCLYTHTHSLSLSLVLNCMNVLPVPKYYVKKKVLKVLKEMRESGRERQQRIKLTSFV